MVVLRSRPAVLKTGEDEKRFPYERGAKLHKSPNLFKRCLLIWEHPVWAAILVLPIYTLLAAQYGSLWQPSRFAYFNYLADAFIHGQLHLRLNPPSTHDLISFSGNYYLYWSPLPAILLAPFIAAFGVHFSDVIFTIGVATFNVFLVALLMRHACKRLIIKLCALQRGFLVMFVALGTVHVTLAPHGRIWFTGQLVAFLCILSAYFVAITTTGQKAFILTGLALAATALTRNHVLLAGLWPICYLLRQHASEGLKRLLAHALAGVSPIVLALGFLGIYNWLRFGNVFDNGFAYHQMAQEFVGDFQRYGTFNLQFLSRNLFYQYIAYPLPIRPTTFQGGSLFLLSPVFFAAFWGIVAGRPRWSTYALLGSILLVAAPILLLMGTGWVQFGPRYTLDFTVPLLLLTALGVRRWPIGLLGVFTAASLVQYLLGAAYLGAYLALLDRL